MSRKLPGKSYALTGKHHQYLSEKAVSLTKELDEPIACRHVLDALLNLGMEANDQTLSEAVQRRLKEPRRRRT